MKLVILHLGVASKHHPFLRVLWRFESIVTLQGYKPDNMTQRVKLGPPYPSAIFHAYASADTSWVAQTLYHCTPMKYGGVSSNLVTVEATQFVGH
jgi:hypothetical protein